MMKYKSLGSSRTRLIQILALLVASLLLVSCAPKPQEPAGSVTSQPAGTDSSPENTETPSSVFEGLVGQDWYVIDVPLFEEQFRVRDLAYGAGKLWAVGTQGGVDYESYRTPALLSSADGLNWEQSDLTALGVPENLTGEARLLGTDETITVLFENPRGEDAAGDLPQRRPWILRGDGDTWRLISEETFGPWQVNNRGSGKFLNYWDLEALAENKGQLVLMPAIGWFEPYSTSDRSLGLGLITADDQAELVADFDALRSPYLSQFAIKMLVYRDQYWSFANSYAARGEEGGVLFFNIWRSADGRDWTNETPALEGILDYTGINDAVAGPKGLLVTGWQAGREEGEEYAGTPTPIALFSSDGASWTVTPLGEGQQEDFKAAATDSTYYAYDEEARIWYSTDGLTWNEASPINLYTRTLDKKWSADLSTGWSISKIVGLPGGLIALGGPDWKKGTSIMFSGDLPFDYLNQK